MVHAVLGGARASVDAFWLVAVESFRAPAKASVAGSNAGPSHRSPRTPRQRFAARSAPHRRGRTRGTPTRTALHRWRGADPRTAAPPRTVIEIPTARSTTGWLLQPGKAQPQKECGTQDGAGLAHDRTLPNFFVAVSVVDPAGHLIVPRAAADPRCTPWRSPTGTPPRCEHDVRPYRARHHSTSRPRRRQGEVTRAFLGGDALPFACRREIPKDGRNQQESRHIAHEMAYFVRAMNGLGRHDAGVHDARPDGEGDQAAML